MVEPELQLVIAPEVDLSNPAVSGLIVRLETWQQLFSPGSERFSLSGYEQLYEASAERLLAYDNYSERDTRWLGFERYRAIWEREINQHFPGFVMYRIEVDRVEVEGDFGWTAFTWFGRVASGDGLAWPAQHGTQIWRRSEGAWRIVHEHLTSGVKEHGELVTGERRPGLTAAGFVKRHRRAAPACA